MKPVIREILPYTLCAVLSVFVFSLNAANNQLQETINRELGKEKQVLPLGPSYSDLVLKEHKKGYEEFVEDKKDTNESPFLACNGKDCNAISVTRFPIGRVVCCKLDGTVPEPYSQCVHCMCVNTTVALETMAGTFEYHAINPIKGVDY